MDRQEPVEMELDWDVIEEQAKRYDEGDLSFICLRAKMLEMAYQDGYNQCMQEHEEATNHFKLMMTQPAGHA
jgi:hypothetical protein